MAGLKRGANVDYAGNQILNVVIQVLSAAPGSPTPGLVYYDSTFGAFGYYSGLSSSWVYATPSPAATGSSLGTVELAGDLAGTGSTATAPTVGNLHLTGDTAIGHKLTSVTDPTNPQDAATKNYVDNTIEGLAPKTACALATAAALPGYVAAGSGATKTLTASVNGALTIDGVAAVLGWRILVLNSATIGPGNVTLGGAAAAADSGIYTVTNAGSGGTKWVLTRAVDMNTWAETVGALIPVQAGGTVNGDTIYLSTTQPGGTLETTAVNFGIYQSAVVVTGDGVYTSRTGNVIGIIPAAISATPANGSTSAASLGNARIANFTLAGNASATVFTCTHNWNTYQLQGWGQVQSGGNPSSPIELDWTPSSANAVQITFPSAPGTGIVYYFQLVG